jgi:hypothetical protein
VHNSLKQNYISSTNSESSRTAIPNDEKTPRKRHITGASITFKDKYILE